MPERRYDGRVHCCTIELQDLLMNSVGLLCSEVDMKNEATKGKCCKPFLLHFKHIYIK